MMWRKVINGEVIIAPTVEGPGYSLGPNDTIGIDGWEPVEDDYVEQPDLTIQILALQAKVDELLELIRSLTQPNSG